MGKEIIQTNNAPQAIGAYSQAVKTGNLLFISGQIPLDPASGAVVDGDVEQIQQVFKNLSAICLEAGGSLNDIVKLNVYLTDLSLFSSVNAVMETHFIPPFPARAAVEVAGLPKGVKIEVEAVMQMPA